ncbi:hypothetical protein UY3_09547 [Chelonia mydas]|uniref:Uncharacterized protein n=1 Tax=Chelonia mydas TaxID=8469 RepID=M7BZ08_CHEMY|nr:hypothetical protein UY3_09547 [Chelonia mydas]
MAEGAPEAGELIPKDDQQEAPLGSRKRGNLDEEVELEEDVVLPAGSPGGAGSQELFSTPEVLNGEQEADEMLGTGLCQKPQASESVPSVHIASCFIIASIACEKRTFQPGTVSASPSQAWEGQALHLQKHLMEVSMRPHSDRGRANPCVHWPEAARSVSPTMESETSTGGTTTMDPISGPSQEVRKHAHKHRSKSSCKPKKGETPSMLSSHGDGMRPKAHRHEKKLHKSTDPLIPNADLHAQSTSASLRARKPSIPGKTIAPVPGTEKPVVSGRQSPAMGMVCSPLNKVPEAECMPDLPDFHGHMPATTSLYGEILTALYGLLKGDGSYFLPSCSFWGYIRV